MPVKVINTEYRTEIKNGKDFDLNPNDFTTYLNANAGERCQVKMTVVAFNEFELEDWGFYLFTENGDDKVRITLENDGFKDFNGVVGDDLEFRDDSANTWRFVGTIESLTKDTLVLTNYFPLEDGSNNLTNKTFTGPDHIIKIGTRTHLFFKPNFIVSDEDFTLENQYTGEEGIFYIDLLANGVSVQGEYVGNINGISGSVRVENRFSDSGVSAVNIWSKNLNTHYFKFDLYYDFVVPFINDEIRTEVLNKVVPSIYPNDTIYKDVYGFELRRFKTDISSANIDIYDSSVTNVKPLGQSLDGNKSPYTITSYNYFDFTDNPIDSLLAIGTSRINITVTSEDPVFTIITQPVMYITDLLTDEEAISETGFEETWSYQSVKYNDPATTNKTSGITIHDFTVVSPNEINFNFYHTPSVSRSSDVTYMVLLGIDDESQSNANDSSKSILVVDINNFQKSEDIQGIFLINTFSMTGMQQPGIATSDYKGVIQDDVSIYTQIAVDKDARLDDLYLSYVATNGTEEYEIYKQDFDVSAPVINGVQQFNINESLNYSVPFEAFNVKSLNYSSDYLNFNVYTLITNMKIPHQGWLKALEKADYVYDKNEPNNGQNRDIINYIKDGYTIKLKIQSEVFYNGTLSDNQDTTTTYEAYQDVEIVDYDTEVVDTAITEPYCTLEMYDQDYNPITGNIILQDEPTIVRGKFKIEGITTDNDYNVIIYAENGTGDEFSLVHKPLIKKWVENDQLVVEAILNGEQRISFRVAGNNFPETNILTRDTDGEPILKENGNVTTREQ